MHEVVVAIDLETTGFDTAKDRIIEIGAVRFSGDSVIDKWQSLVNPGFPIPSYITQLTGITNKEVDTAPTIARVVPKLREFIGDDVLVGHNLQFDLGFLRANGLKLSNPTFDTYAIASSLLPTASRYNLTALAKLLDVQVTDAHRALNDSLVTAELVMALSRRAENVSLEIVAEIVRAGHLVDWEGRLFFESILRARSGKTVEPMSGEHSEEFDFSAPSQSDDKVGKSLKPRRTIERIDIDEAVAHIKAGGSLSNSFSDYEHRPEQAAMLRTVAEALNSGQHILIEAPTGVGKSLAYLIPSALFAVKNDDRVVISTNTIPLQEQLMTKDIPLLQNALKIPFRAALLKGRSNYLCPRRLASLRRHGPASSEEMLMLARILIWMTVNSSGDRGDFALRGPVESALWTRLSAEDEGCKTERCLSQMGGVCPFYRARRAAENAHILVVNHALLLSDVATEGRVLPDYKNLIIDEAHHLEEATTNGLSFRTAQEAVSRQIKELGTANSGMLGEMLRACQGSIPSGHFSTLSEFVSVVVQAASYMSKHVELFFVSLSRFLQSQGRNQSSDYTQFVRILPSTRRQPSWAEIETHWDNLSQFTSSIAEAMTRLEGGLRELEDYDIDEYDDLVAGIGSAARHWTELHQRLNALVSAPDTNTVYWAELQPGFDRMSVHAAPLDVGPLVKQYLWDTKDTIVMTSATLQTKGSFSYIRSQLDADHVSEAVIPSPFDYEASTLLYLVDDIPEPAEAMAYQRSLERGVLNLCKATQGRAMILFTSYAQLRETANAISESLLADGIVLYDQANGSSRMQLLEGFVQSEKAVLMGTRSFWEGVDVPGTDLSVLVIARLPFSVPTDPLFSARSERYQDPFLEYSIPETLLRFRQGFGRLIRRKSDRGVVAIFDRRIITKRYGQLFLDSLPRCTLRRGPLSDLPRAAAQWLDVS